MRQEKHLRCCKVTSNQLVEDFRSIGLEKGDGVMVHSSLSSMGHVEGGADAVFDALMETLGSSGHLMFPTFSFNIDLGPWDPGKTPTTMGAIAEAAWRRPEFIRSDFPFNAVAVCGPRRKEITRNHLASGWCRPGDPHDRLARMGGKILLIGVTMRSCTLIHIGEVMADLPHRRVVGDDGEWQVRCADGREISIDTRGRPGCDEGFGAVEGIMRERNHIRDGKIGAAPSKLFSGMDCLVDTVDLIERSPTALYCNDKRCEYCTRWRNHIHHIPG